MPLARIEIKNTNDSIVRPVMLDVIRQLMDKTRISSKTPIRFLSDEATAAQQGSSVNRNVIKENIWPYDEFVTIEVECEVDPVYFGSLQTLYASSLFTFRDDATGVSVRPMYAKMDVGITVKYTHRDKAMAVAWRNMMHARASQQNLINLHTTQYHYEFSEQIADFLRHVHALIENQGGYGDTFEEYVRKHLTCNSTVITDVAGKNKTLVITERQTRIQGYFEFEPIVDKPEKVNDSESYEQSFTYKLQFDMPMQYQLWYPNVIHNQLIDEAYRYTKLIDPSTASTYSTAQTQAMRVFESQSIVKDMGQTGTTVPWFDEFTPEYVLPSTVRLMSALVCVVPSDLKSLVNLNEQFDDHEIDPDILEFILQSEWPYITKNYKSILQIHLYRDRQIEHDAQLVLDTQGALLADTNLNIRRIYRLRFSIVANLSLLDAAAFYRLSLFPKARDKVVQALDWCMKHVGGEKDIRKRYLSFMDLLKFGYSYKEIYDRLGLYDPYARLKDAYPNPDQFDLDEYPLTSEQIAQITNWKTPTVSQFFLTVSSKSQL